MGFSGGGSNILKPHTHDSNILQDGGNLDFKNITQGDMSAGSITYSNGSHLQELVKPGSPAGESLTFAAAASAPSWVIPTNADRLEQLAFYETVNATTDTVTLTFTEIDLDDYASLYLTFSGVLVGALDIEITMGDGAGYRYGYDQSDAGTWSNVNTHTQTEWKLTDLAAGAWFVGHCWLAGWTSNEGGDGYAAHWQVHSDVPSSNNIGGGFTNSGSSAITSVVIQTSTSYFAQYCKFNLMGLRRSA